MFCCMYKERNVQTVNRPKAILHCNYAIITKLFYTVITREEQSEVSLRENTI